MVQEPLPDNSKSEQITKKSMYEQTCGIWKTLVDFRFKIFASFLTLTSLLAVGLVSTLGENNKQCLSIIFAILGVVLTLTMWIIEYRNRILYRAALHFGKHLESDEKFSSGILTVMDNSWENSTISTFRKEFWKNINPTTFFKTPLTQSKMFDVIFIVMFIVWFFVFLYTVFAPTIPTTQPVVFWDVQLVCPRGII